MLLTQPVVESEHILYTTTIYLPTLSISMTSINYATTPELVLLISLKI